MNSFMYGRSVSNQRIEAWWSFLRKSDTDWTGFSCLYISSALTVKQQVEREIAKFDVPW